jgi:hypothetical protein
MWQSDVLGATLRRMFGKRKDVNTDARASVGGPITGLAGGEPQAQNGNGPEQGAHTGQALTLTTMCACGHTRRDHRGLRIDLTGSCLECDCEEFARDGTSSESDEQMMRRIRAALERVERLQQAAARLHAQASEAALDPDE